MMQLLQFDIGIVFIALGSSIYYICIEGGAIGFKRFCLQMLTGRGGVSAECICMHKYIAYVTIKKQSLRQKTG